MRPTPSQGMPARFLDVLVEYFVSHVNNDISFAFVTVFSEYMRSQERVYEMKIALALVSTDVYRRTAK